MKDKKIQIFVSSTYSDLKEERQAAVEAILSSGHIPAGMELFAAGDESQWTVIQRWIDESDVYLLILGGRYGSIEPKSGKSYTQLEYEYALTQKKPLFSVVISEKALDEKLKSQGAVAIERDNSKLLNEFRALVLTNLVKFWDDKKDIKIAIHETISEFGYRKELIGWIRGDNQVNTGILAEEIARLTKENAELREKLMTAGPSNGVLYAGMTYEEMRNLLKNEIINIDGGRIDLFEYLLSIGKSISPARPFIRGANGASKLALYKILRVVGNDMMSTSYGWTEDGQNFYLKTLSLFNQNI